ncbi:MAG: hypothetical protein U1F57_03420 [bacterium]
MKKLKPMMFMFIFVGLIGFFCSHCSAISKKTPTPANPCGISPTDWCPSPAGDSCGAHKNEKECRADPKCKGMPYRGESVEACMADGRGFWSNCPAVGCVSR